MSLIGHERDYLERTIATVRNHRDADNCWPQWANIFADEIERLWDETDGEKELLHTELVEAREAFNASCRETDRFEVKARTAEAALVALEAEIERLTAALEEIAEGCEQPRDVAHNALADSNWCKRL